MFGLVEVFDFSSSVGHRATAWVGLFGGLLEVVPMLYDFAVLETENLIKIDAMRYTRKLQFLVRYLGEVFEFELKKGGG